MNKDEKIKSLLTEIQELLEYPQWVEVSSAHWTYYSGHVVQKEKCVACGKERCKRCGQ